MYLYSTNPNKEETTHLYVRFQTGESEEKSWKEKKKIASFTELCPSIPRTLLKLIIRWNEFKIASFEKAVKSILSRHWPGGNNNLWKSSGVRPNPWKTVLSAVA